MEKPGIIGDRLVVSIRLPEGVKMTTVAYCNLLNEVLVPWLEDMPLSLLGTLIFMHNTPSHSSRPTKLFLGSYGIQDERLAVWLPTSPDLNPIKTHWSLIKQDVYVDGCQFTSKDIL